ncbi:MAG: DUF4131 domain-containing protein [Chitinivibrionales bacterium]|nr:DUF4131 domain-containing protein [Chitinivibrionales bacterium]
MLQKTNAIVSAVFPHIKSRIMMPAVIGLAGLGCGIALSHIITSGLHTELYINAVLVSTLVALAAGILCGHPFARFLAFGAAGFCVLTCHLSRQQAFFAHLTPLCSREEPVVCNGRIISPVVDYYGKYRFLFRLDAIVPQPGDTIHINAVVECICPVKPYAYGIMSVSGVYRPPKPPVSFGGFDQYTYMLGRGIRGRLYVREIAQQSPTDFPPHRAAGAVRTYMLRILEKVDNQDNRAILQASLLGERQSLSSELKTRYREAGIYHLLSISGLHIGMLIAFVLVILGKLPVHKSVRVLIAIGLIWAYTLFVGLMPSIVRASIMATLLLSSLLIGRSSNAINSLGIAGIVWLLFSPQSLFAPGFQLSFAATFGILLLTPRIKKGIEAGMPSADVQAVLDKGTASFAVSMAGFIATAPVLAWHFGALTPFGLLANLLAVVLMTGAMWSLFAAMIAGGIAPLAEITTAFSSLLLSGIDGLARLSTFVPFAHVEVVKPGAELIVAFVASALLIGSAHRKRVLRVALLCLLGIMILLPGSLILRRMLSRTEIIAFSTRHRALAAITWRKGKRWLVGTLDESAGASSLRNSIAPWMRTSFSKELDAVLLDGANPRLIQHADRLLAQYRPRTIYLYNAVDWKVLHNLRQIGAEAGCGVERVFVGDTLVAGRQQRCVVHNEGGSFALQSGGNAVNLRKSSDSGFHLSVDGEMFENGRLSAVRYRIGRDGQITRQSAAKCNHPVSSLSSCF